MFLKILANMEVAQSLWKGVEAQPKCWSMQGNAIKWTFTKFHIDQKLTQDYFNVFFSPHPPILGYGGHEFSLTFITDQDILSLCSASHSYHSQT
uniref:Uncharacterized protein n=1 Tax=Ailuropoda melanoleuca TaxID=9646 RepID=A0A7N5K3N8_AILME